MARCIARSRPAHRALLSLLASAALGSLLGACGSSTPAASADRASPQSGAATPGLANGCFALRSALTGRFVTAAGDAYRADADVPGAAAFFLKPSRLDEYLPQDADSQFPSARDAGAVGRDGAPGPATEWAFDRLSGDAFEIVSGATGARLAVSPAGVLVQSDPSASGPESRFALVPREGCTPFPEAEVGARGAPFAGRNADGTVAGFADLHLHITAALRAGGQVISGEPFDRFGIVQALGHDADVHGPDGSLDVTGNLLRTGLPAGTHDTNGWPTFAGWPVFDTNTHQQIYYAWLQRAWMAGERLVVAQTVEDHPLCEIEPRQSHSCDETATIELEVQQLRDLQDYVDAQAGGRGLGWFRLVEDPGEARRVIEQGKMAVVIGVESSDLFGCSELLGQPQCTRDDVDRGLAHFLEIGVRSVFPAHWVDNAFAGAALEGGSKGVFIGAMEVAQTGHPFRTGPCPDPSQGEADATGARACNSKGLTDLGEYLVQRLIDHHVMIDVDHMSELARERVLAMAEARHYPLVSSHTNTGGTWSDSELRRLYALGGLATARIDAAPALAATILGLEKFRRDDFYFGVGLGSDTGGFASLPAPRADAAQAPLAYPFTSLLGAVVFERQQSGARTYDLNDDGVAHYGLVPDLLADLRAQGGAAAVDPLLHSVEAYLQAWQRADGPH